MTETTRAEVPAHTGGTAIHVPDGVLTGGGLVGGVGSIILLVFALRKRWSRDNLELTKDRAETDLIRTYQATIKSLQSHNDKLDANAREAWRTRAEDAKRIGELTSKVEHLTTVNEGLEKTVDSLHTRIDDLVAMVRSLLPHDERLHALVHGGNLKPVIKE